MTSAEHDSPAPQEPQIARPLAHALINDLTVIIASADCVSKEITNAEHQLELDAILRAARRAIQRIRPNRITQK